MEALQPSRTALGAAMHRAAHQLLDHPPLFSDPLALPILGPDAENELHGDWHGRQSPGLRAFIAVRSRFAEDCLAEAMSRGVSQYVLLGAGLDTFAYRNAIQTLAIFEVDHPATQAWKQSRLAEAGLTGPHNIRYVPVDFERDTVFDALARSAFTFSDPALFAWRGVTPYLAEETVIATLRSIAGRMPSGSEIVFDYAEPPAALDEQQRPAFTAMAERVASLGEPFRCFFEPAPLGRALLDAGFARVDDFDTTALNARYFAGRADGLKLRGRAHLVRALV